jgi:hypothetical protein
MMTTIVGRFSDLNTAQRTVQELERNGFTSTDVSLMRANTGASNLVTVRADDETADRARKILERQGADAIDEEHSSLPSEASTDFGSEGSPSEWGKRVLTADGVRDSTALRNVSKRRRT